MSKAGAFKLLEGVEKVKKAHHFDIWLRSACTDQIEGLQASFVLPSVGSYDEHISGCDPTNTGVPGGWRPANWNDYWCEPGVRIERRDGNHKGRSVCDFRGNKKPFDWGVQVHFNDGDIRMLWRTEKPPIEYWQGGSVWDSILQQRGRLDDYGWFRIPPALSQPRSNHAWRELQMDADGHPWDAENQTYLPISRIAEHVVIWHEDECALSQSRIPGQRASCPGT